MEYGFLLIINPLQLKHENEFSLRQQMNFGTDMKNAQKIIFWLVRQNKNDDIMQKFIKLYWKNF